MTCDFFFLLVYLQCLAFPPQVYLVYRVKFNKVAVIYLHIYIYIICMCVCVYIYIYIYIVAKSCPTLVTPWTGAWKAPLSMEFSRPEYWSGLPFPSLADLPDPGLKLWSLALQLVSCIAGRFFTNWATREVVYTYIYICVCVCIYIYIYIYKTWLDLIIFLWEGELRQKIDNFSKVLQRIEAKI